MVSTVRPRTERSDPHLKSEMGVSQFLGLRARPGNMYSSQPHQVYLDGTPMEFTVGGSEKPVAATVTMMWIGTGWVPDLAKQSTITWLPWGKQVDIDGGGDESPPALD